MSDPPDAEAARGRFGRGFAGMRSLVSALVVAGTASGAAVLPSDGPAEAREGPVAVPSFHHRRRRGMDLSRWTLRFVPAGAGAKRMPNSRADGDASCVAADGIDVGARPAAAALERRYMEQTALSSAVGARVASILVLLVNIMMALTLPRNERFGAYPWIQLGFSAPFQLALFGASFSRGVFPRIFEPLASLSVVSFSISQRFMFEILAVYNVTGDRCAYHAPIICVIMLWFTCTFLNLRFHVSVIVSLLLVLECALSGVLAVAASYLRERGERRLFLQVLAAGHRTSPPPDSSPFERRAPPLQLPQSPSAGADSADEERPAERAAPAPGPAGDTPRPVPFRSLAVGSGSGAGLQTLAPEAGAWRTSGGGSAPRTSSGSAGSFASARALALRLSPAGVVPEWSASGSTPGPDTPSSRDPLTGPEGGTGDSAEPANHEEAARVAPRGRLRRLLRWLVAGSPFPSPEAERGYQIFYCNRAWSRVRFLSAPLLAMYLSSLASAAALAASRSGLPFLEFVGPRRPDWILEFFVCGGVFLAGTVMLHARPARLVPFIAFFTTGACLVGQMAALTSLRRFESIAPYIVEVSLYITFTMISSTFWVPPRAFLLASCVSLPYGLYALSPRDPLLSGRIVDMAGFILSPVAVCLVVCLRQERKLRTLFLLHAPEMEDGGGVPTSTPPGSAGLALSFAALCGGVPAIRVAPA